MKIIPDTLIGEIAVELDGAAELFEEKKINYFFKGRQTLRDTCDEAEVAVEEVLAGLAKLRAAEPPRRGVDWRDKSLRDIIDYIVKRQHVFIRLRLTCFRKRAFDLARSGRPWNPIFPQLNEAIQDMARQMEGHMDNEEKTVFPYLRAMEQVRYAQNGGAETLLGPSSYHMLASLVWKHEAMWDKWILLRSLISGFHPEGNQNEDFAILCRGLEEFEGYIRQHGHLEDNILFRKARDMGILY